MSKVLYIFIGLILSFSFYSCSSHVFYMDKYGSNDIVVYEDSIFKVQRSTEVYGDELLISHLINKKRGNENCNLSIEDMTNSIDNWILKDTLSYSCGYKKNWYKKFSNIPVDFRNFKGCTSFQLIYFFHTNSNLPSKIIITTNMVVLDSGTLKNIYYKDTLFKDVKHSLPQP